MRPLSVETGTLCPKERFDFLNDVYARERLVLAPKQPVGTSISAGSSLWEVGSIRFAKTYSSGHIGRRVQGKGAAYLAIRKHFTGGCHSWSEDGYFVTQPGDILLTINTSDGVHACGELRTTNIALPLDMFDIDLKVFRTTQILPAGSLGNTLLSVAMDAWTDQLQDLSRSKASLLETEIVSLVSHVLSNSFEAVEDDAALSLLRADAMRQFVNDNLFSGRLTVERISEAFGASRSSIYRAFAEDGGVHRYIANRKLRAALFILADREAKRGSVRKIAHLLGYADVFAFSKAFRSHFGFSPSEVLSLPSRSGLEIG